jgi:phosphate transport system substrate-binding protein
MRTGRGAVLALMLLAAGCQPAPPTNVTNVVVTGSYAMAPLVRAIGKRFEKEHAGVRIGVQMNGSERGLTDTRQGLADIGMVARRLRLDETNLHGFPIARDGIALIVNQRNPIKELDDHQVVRIYRQTVSNWKQLGGNNAPLFAISQAEGRSARSLFLDYFQLTNNQTQPHLIIGDNQEGIDAVAARANAIAYVSLAAAEAAIAAGKPIRLLSIDGVAATSARVRDDSYPLSRPLLLVTRDQPQGPMLEFIDFARSEAVRDLVEKYHFVPLNDAAAPEKQH